MDRLVLLMVDVRQEQRRKAIEGQLAVRLRIGDRLVVLGGLQRLAVGLGVRLGAEQREAERIAPHVQTAQRIADDGAEFRPQRLGVAHRVEVLADRGRPPAILVLDQLVIGAAGRQRGIDVSGGLQRAGHRIVHALDARHVDEARGAADQRAAGEGQPRHRLVAAFGDRARAIGQALGAGKGVADLRVGLEALEFLERVDVGVFIVQMQHEADRDEVIVVVVQERAATGGIVERPAERVLHQTLLVPGGIDLPDFLEADAEFRRLAILVEREFGNQLFGQAAAGAFGKQRVLAEQFHAAGEGILRLAVAADAHVASGDAAHRTILVIQRFGGGEARIDLDAERLGARAEPARHHAERGDVAVMVVHQRRHHEVRQRQAAGLGHEEELVFLDLGLDRAIGIVAPVRDQFVERHRIDHRTGQDVGADFRALLDHHDREFRIELFEPDRRGQSRGTGPHDDNIEFHGFARRQFFNAHNLISDRFNPFRTLLRALVYDFEPENNSRNAPRAFRRRAICPRLRPCPI